MIDVCKTTRVAPGLTLGFLAGMHRGLLLRVIPGFFHPPQKLRANLVRRIHTAERFSFR